MDSASPRQELRRKRSASHQADADGAGQGDDDPDGRDDAALLDFAGMTNAR